MKTISRKRFIEGAAAGALFTFLCLALEPPLAEELLSVGESREGAEYDAGRPGSSGTAPDYLDGVYHGSAFSRGGRIDAEIIIKGGALSSVEVNYPGNPGLRYFHSPFSVLSGADPGEGFDLSKVDEASGVLNAAYQAVSQALGKAASRTAETLGPI